VAEGTAIEWADDSWNPIRAKVLATGALGHYCVKVSPGCKNCYAERLQAWPIGSRIRYAAQDRDELQICLDEQALEQPLRRRRGRDIFPCSMTDLFLEHHADEWLARIFDVMYRCPQHRFLVLTKRAQRMHDFIVGKHGAGNNAFAFRNVWFGISAENEDQWVERAPYVDVMRALGFNTWASFEPLLTDIDPGPYRVHWAVIGGESGPGCRPTVIGHIRALLRALQAAGVATFVKQLGAKPVNREGLPHRVKDQKGGNMAEWPEDLRVRMSPAACS
jgi:protein gp37